MRERDENSETERFVKASVKLSFYGGSNMSRVSRCLEVLTVALALLPAGPTVGTPLDTTAEQGGTALVAAATESRTDAVKRLLVRGAKPDVADRYGVTPLYVAALNADTALMTTLLAAGADPNGTAPSGETLLMTAARTGAVETMRLLIAAGARVDAREPAFNQSALMIAARGNAADAVALLLDRGAAVDARTAIGKTPPFVPPCKGTGCGSEGVGINRGGLPDRGRRDAVAGGMTPLLYAAREGADASLATLIARGADLEVAEANGMTPLLMALLNNQLGAARQLIEAGAKVNVADFYGRTPLWAAVEHRNLDMNNRIEDSPTTNNVDRAASLPMIRLLLDTGADVDARTREVPPSRKWLYALNDVSWVDFTGQTAFLRAAFAGDTTVMQLLLDHGADPNLATQGGTTPLMAAAGVGWVVQQTYTESMPSLLEAVRLCLASISSTSAFLKLLCHLASASKDALSKSISLLASSLQGYFVQSRS
ncbi:MAG: hypothetical protein EOP08_03760 [Proteobacteria bacterium]|nr:MAG: hypothetical protein EOP08_03760 [Pseudomonadota bacterium]